MKTIKKMKIDFKEWKSYDNGQLTDYIFDMKGISIIFDSVQVDGQNIMFRRGGHLGSVVSMDLSQYEFGMLVDTMLEEVGYNG